MRDLDRDFAEFHAENPHVYDALVALARQAKARGHRALGIGMLWEVLRWNRLFDTRRDAEGFKLNNNLRSRYAREIHAREPDLAGIFHLRDLHD